MSTSYTAISNSSFADYDSFFDTGLSTQPLPTASHVPSEALFNVALVLDRNIETPQQQAAFNQLLYTDNWAERQQALKAMGDSLWDVYGANPTDYADVTSYLKGKFTFFGQGDGASDPKGYVSNEQSRTVWVQLNAADFEALFHTQLLASDRGDGKEFYFWQGNLSLPTEIASKIQGLWFDTQKFTHPLSPPADPSKLDPLTPGIQGVGNGIGSVNGGQPADPMQMDPQDVAALYNFPLTSANAGLVELGELALMEPGLGDKLPDGASFQDGVDAYLKAIGITGVQPTVTGIALGGADGSASDERALDIGVASAINPGATFLLYAGSGKENSAKSDPLTPYQSAFFDPDHDPLVVSSSFRFENAQPSPNSPFMWAARQLFIDGLLQNITVFNSSGDGGSGYAIANGQENTDNSRTSPYTVVVGGTSLSTLATAATDPTLATITASALGELGSAQQMQVLWQLVQGGLTTLPDENSPESLSAWFAQSVWNRYYVSTSGSTTTIEPGFLQNQSSNGGVDFTQTTPSYQWQLLALDAPTTTDGSNVVGRGVPDVSALSSGNMFYTVPQGNLPLPTSSSQDITRGDGGTSAATPFWASLILQINAILRDQGIDYDLGYMNDLLYAAAVIAPASFNDVTLGDNTSSFYDNPDSSYLTPPGKKQPANLGVTPTGYGYQADEGYDLASGLGSPNGVILAKTLSAIANQQISYADSYNLLAPDGTSAMLQTVLIHSMPGNSMNVGSMAVVVDIGSTPLSFTTEAASVPWNPRMAQASLQSTFDSDLVTLFDAISQSTAAQGSVVQATLQYGQSLAVSVNGSAATAYTLAMTSPFGFADFETSDGIVRVARPVAVAETMEAGTQEAVVSIRQNGQDSLSVMFYQVTDLTGAIGTVLPGDPNYAAAALNAAYVLSSGSKILNGPGYGNFASTRFTVDSGDYVAMQLVDNTQHTTYWAFAQANETSGGQPVGHLWSYGLNTWGWEDTAGGGDSDYNDLIVGIDFTSTAGHSILV